MLDETLTHLVGCLQTTLSVLEGSENAELKAALHDHTKLPDRLLAKKAAKAVDLLHRAEQLLEPGPLVLADHFLGYVDSKCLCAAVELNIADLLNGEPQTLAKLAKSSNARADRLRQIMRILHNNGIFSYDGASDTYSNNSTSVMLLRDHWTQWHNWVDLYGNEFYNMARGIPASCRADAIRMPAQINYDTDKNMFTYFQEQGWMPRLHKTLSGGAIAQGLGIAEDYPWEELAGKPFLDVGGGGGGLVALALRRHKNLQAGILDLPRVIEQASLNFHSAKGEYADVGDRVSKENLIPGDFLEKIPPFECYTMKWCLHDWKDPGAITILSNIRKAIVKGPRSRLVVFESLLEEGRIGRLSRYADITMMVSANGQERDEKQWRELAAQSGWRIREIYHLRNAWPCAIEMVPDWDDSPEVSQSDDASHVSGTTTTTENYAVTNGHSLNGTAVNEIVVPGASSESSNEQKTGPKDTTNGEVGELNGHDVSSTAKSTDAKIAAAPSESKSADAETVVAPTESVHVPTAVDKSKALHANSAKTVENTTRNETTSDSVSLPFPSPINPIAQLTGLASHATPNITSGSPSHPEIVSTKMTFLEPWDTATKGSPYYRSAPAPGFDSTNFSWQDHGVLVTDARPNKDSFTLDKNAFQYIDDPEPLGEELVGAMRSGDREAVERLYYPRVEALVKRQTGGKRVIIFDHTLRKRRKGLEANENPDGREQPATIVHCDQSAKGALRRLKQNLDEGDDYDEIVKGRVQMINIWRPINAPVQDWPLAQLDYTTLSPRNTHACDLWRGEFEERGQTMTFEHGEEQRWYFLKEHGVDEVTMIKIWDSEKGVADCCPHAAFEHPDTPVDAPPRESVEVRCLVLYPPAQQAVAA